jgi:hypothetical protein
LSQTGLAVEVSLMLTNSLIKVNLAFSQILVIIEPPIYLFHLLLRHITPTLSHLHIYKLTPSFTEVISTLSHHSHAAVQDYLSISSASSLCLNALHSDLLLVLAFRTLTHD